jgi:GNAT superfamily N-acetyltransferase
MEFEELSAATWPLFERLLGPSGLQGGCWCAFFRMTGSRFRGTDAAQRKQHVRTACERGRPLGLLAVFDGEPAGWVAVSPRVDNPRLARSPIAALPPGESGACGIWSVTCFYIDRRTRRQGLAGRLLEQAVHYAARRGARMVEGYPVAVTGKRPSTQLYHGTVSTFAAAGFRLVERRGTSRALMRRDLAPG